VAASATDEAAIRRVQHDDLQERLRAHRTRVAPRLREAFDALVVRHGFLTDDADTFFHPLVQPLVTFPRWVAAAAGGVGEPVVRDLVESTVMGYLHVRVHDDVMDEGHALPTGDPSGVAASFLLADSFYERHVALLATHVSSVRFWDLHQSVAARYADAMLLERELSAPHASYGRDDFARVLDRSLPLVVPGAAIFELTDRWDDVDALAAFVHHVVRAGQIVDDLMDLEHDVRLGNHSWVARQLGSTEQPTGMRVALATGGLRRLVREALEDLAHARELAVSLGMPDAARWTDARSADVVAYERHALTSLLFD
jgi:hypothetical protein